MGLLRCFTDRWRWANAIVLANAHRLEEALHTARGVRDEFKQRMEWATFEVQQLALLQWGSETSDSANRFVLKHSYPSPLRCAFG